METEFPICVSGNAGPLPQSLDRPLSYAEFNEDCGYACFHRNNGDGARAGRRVKPVESKRRPLVIADSLMADEQIVDANRELVKRICQKIWRWGNVVEDFFLSKSRRLV